MVKKSFLLGLLCGLLFLLVLADFLLYAYRLRNSFSETRKQLIAVVSNSALSIDSEELLKVPLVQSGDYSAEYQDIFRKLTRIKEANPFVKYVYIMTTTEQPGILQYVVDADPVPEIITARTPSALPGDKYDARKLPEMMAAYGGPTADKKITTDAWGPVISGYAPIRDPAGRPVAIICVDTDASSMRAMQEGLKSRGILVLSIGLTLFLLSAMTLMFSVFRRQENPQQ